MKMFIYQCFQHFTFLTFCETLSDCSQQNRFPANFLKRISNEVLAQTLWHFSSTLIFRPSTCLVTSAKQKVIPERVLQYAVIRQFCSINRHQMGSRYRLQKFWFRKRAHIRKNIFFLNRITICGSLGSKKHQQRERLKWSLKVKNLRSFTN